MVKLPVGVTFHLKDQAIEKITLDGKQSYALSFEGERDSELEERITAWMERYRKGEQRPEDHEGELLPLNWDPLSPFNRKVLEKLAEVPFGATLSYSQLAQQCGCPRSYRAVGNACASNPFPLIIPCHRVLTATRKLGGFAYGIIVKTLLLSHEGVEV